MPLELEPESDLRWTAFLYVVGELSSTEASSFELRLADDQDARDAVVEAVEVIEATRRVAPELRRPTRRRIFVASAWIAAAAGLLLAASNWLVPTSTPRPDAAGVARAWSSLREVEPDESRIVDASPSTIEVASIVEVEADPSADRALPSWLLSAASAPTGPPTRQED